MGLKNLGLGVSVGFGVILRVLFSALYAAFRVVVALFGDPRTALGRRPEPKPPGHRLVQLAAEQRFPEYADSRHAGVAGAPTAAGGTVSQIRIRLAAIYRF